MKLFPPYKGPYLVMEVEGQNVNCHPTNGGPMEIVDISRLKPVKESLGKNRTFVPKLSNGDGSLESSTESPWKRVV